jgi:hypothetical protein
LGEEETIALLQHFEQNQVELDKRQREVLATKVDLAELKVDIKSEINDLRIDLIKLIATTSIAIIGIVLGGVFTLMKLLIPS